MHIKLKSLRAEHGLNQSDLAELLGITVQSYNAKENGKSNFNILEVEKIKSLFGLPYEEIFFNHSSHEMKQIKTTA